MRNSEADLHTVGMKVYVAVPLHRRLKMLAARRGVAMSAIVSELIRAELEKEGAK